mgnify:CR=1 FL=1
MYRNCLFTKEVSRKIFPRILLDRELDNYLAAFIIVDSVASDSPFWACISARSSVPYGDSVSPLCSPLRNSSRSCWEIVPSLSMSSSLKTTPMISSLARPSAPRLLATNWLYVSFWDASASILGRATFNSSPSPGKVFAPRLVRNITVNENTVLDISGLVLV